MTGDTSFPETVRSAIELAGRAPSIHNSQPWQFDLQADRIDLYANYDRWLPATDADRRDVMVSCGAVLHHLRLALGAARIGTVTHRVPTLAGPDLLASVELGTGARTVDDAALVSAIERRRTDRRPFKRWPIPDDSLRKLTDRAAAEGAVLRVVEDTGPRDALVAAFAEAQDTQADVSGYGDELARWTKGAGTGEGIPESNLLRTPAASVDTARGFPPGALEAPVADAPEEATLFVLGTASDDRLSQLRAGEALSAVLLEATRLGFASCPLSQPLEVGHTRVVLRDSVLGGTLSPQIVIRVGWPGSEAPLPPTPRRPVDDTIGLSE